MATTIKSKNNNAYAVLTSKYLLAILANIVVPAVVPPAKTIIPIPSPTLVPPNTALMMTLPVSTCHDSVRLKKTEISTVAIIAVSYTHLTLPTTPYV